MKIPHDWHVFFLAILAGLPAVVVAFVLLLTGDFESRTTWTLGIFIVGFWLGFSSAVRTKVIRPLQTMANLLSALHEGDFSIRARDARRNEPLGEVYIEINTLGSLLQTQRRGALEASALLRTVMEEIDVAIFAFDEHTRLRLANRAAERMLDTTFEEILGKSAAEIGMLECCEGDPARVLDTKKFPGGSGRWGMRRTSFREEGVPHTLVVIADLTRALREEEIKAWQRLVRVLGHELNNSLAPIKSISGSLRSLLKREDRAHDWEEDMTSGLEIIESRAEGLNQFMAVYANLAKLPPPNPAPTDMGRLIRRVAALQTNVPIEIVGGPDITANIDAAQIEQVLINLFKNAAEAVIEYAEETGKKGGIRARWKQHGQSIEIVVEDDGPGIANHANLFVPFFTTKATGSGIGLVLCRQIVENHGGTIALENRHEDGVSGMVARLRLAI